jgi:hypothetical protein
MPQQRVAVHLMAPPMALLMPRQLVAARLMAANRTVAANTTNRRLLNLAAHETRSGGA